MPSLEKRLKVLSHMCVCLISIQLNFISAIPAAKFKPATHRSFSVLTEVPREQKHSQKIWSNHNFFLLVVCCLVI